VQESHESGRFALDTAAFSALIGALGSVPDHLSSHLESGKCQSILLTRADWFGDWIANLMLAPLFLPIPDDFSFANHRGFGKYHICLWH